MKQIKTLLVLCLFLAGIQLSQAQKRYYDEVFADVLVTDSVVYGNNVSIFPAIASQGQLPPSQVPQFMNVYEPMNDTVSERPLILFAHTGTFFPPIVNGGPTGDLNDSVCVEIATRLAKMGYVVAVVSYRKGWLATSSLAEVKRKTILEAAYRGIQDLRACNRYFRETVADSMNPYGVDTTRIAVGGDGTGGYLAYGNNYLKRFDQVFITKFFDFTDINNPVPYVDTLQLGDPYGLTPGTLNVPQNATHMSDHQMGFAIGGALGDSTWVEPGDKPFVSFHFQKDPFAPFGVGDVIEPVNDDVVIPTASGGMTTLAQANAKGNNDIFKSVTWNDPYTIAANANNFGSEGLYNFVRADRMPGDTQCVTSLPLAPDTFQNIGSSWSWYNETFFALGWDFFYSDAIMNMMQITGAEANCRQQLDEPNDAAVARTHIDTIIGYLAPRLVLGLDLETFTTFNIQEDLQEAVGFQVYPNPSQHQFTVKVEDFSNPIRAIRVFDIQGRLVAEETGIRTYEYKLNRGNLPNGIYMLRAEVKDGIINEKIVLE